MGAAWILCSTVWYCRHRVMRRPAASKLSAAWLPAEGVPGHNIVDGALKMACILSTCYTAGSLLTLGPARAATRSASARSSK